MPEHTPGPRRLFTNNCTDSDGEYCGTEYWVLAPNGDEITCFDNEADALLDIAAPDLFEVLTALLERMPAIQDEEGRQLVLKADESPFDPALIAKARTLIPTPAPEGAL